MNNVKPESRLLGLVDMSLAALVEEWTRVASCQAPNVPASLLRRFIAQRMQEKRHRRLPILLSRELDAIAAGGSPIANAFGPASAVTIRPGTRLMREWKGQTISVTAIENGFEYNGRRFGSLTHIAREVTGTHQSGPKFFGLTKRISVLG